MDDHEDLRRFEAGLLTRAEWTHRAHVKIGHLYLRRFPFDEALRRVRTGIEALSAALGTKQTLTTGNNETTTRAFLHLIAATMRAYGEALPISNADSFCDQHPQLLCTCCDFFYSPQQSLNSSSKTEFVELDLAPLPKIDGDEPSSGPG